MKRSTIILAAAAPALALGALAPSALAAPVGIGDRNMVPAGCYGYATPKQDPWMRVNLVDRNLRVVASSGMVHVGALEPLKVNVPRPYSGDLRVDAMVYPDTDPQGLGKPDNHQFGSYATVNCPADEPPVPTPTPTPVPPAPTPVPPAPTPTPTPVPPTPTPPPNPKPHPKPKPSCSVRISTVAVFPRLGMVTFTAKGHGLAHVDFTWQHRSNGEHGRRVIGHGRSITVPTQTVATRVPSRGPLARRKGTQHVYVTAKGAHGVVCRARVTRPSIDPR